MLLHLILNVGKENNIMYSTLTLAFKYFNYYLKASNGKGHGIHSPFVYQWVRKVLNGKNLPSNFQTIEKHRDALKKNTTKIEVLDLGAGSRQSSYKIRSIRLMAQSALKPPKIAQLLYRMVLDVAPNEVLEMGTSFGVTTSYLFEGMQHGKLVTMEGAPAIARMAQEYFNEMGYQQLNLRQGDFAQLLPAYLSEIDTVGLVYIDGNHRYEPTMQYFNSLLEKVNEQSVLIFDDIYWSAEMEKAWNEIKNHPKVTLSIDLFFLGVVFFRKENKQKEHFIIRY